LSNHLITKRAEIDLTGSAVQRQMHALVMKAQHYLNGGSLTDGSSSSSQPLSSPAESSSISSSSALSLSSSSSSSALSDSYRTSATPLQSQQTQPQPPLSLSQPSSHHPSAAAATFALFDPTAPSLQSTPQTFLATNGITQLTAIPSSSAAAAAAVASIDTLGHSMLGSGLSQNSTNKKHLKFGSRASAIFHYLF
jgi:hypothetical protein